MKVFIDTNILLGLYQLSGPDLDELKKIIKLAENDQLTVLLPQQVSDEFWRNRERVIRDALDTFSKTKAQQFLPNIVRSNPKSSELRQAVDLVNALAKGLREETDAAINDHDLAADAIIESLFKLCKPITAEIIQSARLRRDLGNPPGKHGSLGDAVNWEWLLEQADIFDDLTIISGDGDFESELIPSTPKEFLFREWERKTNGHLSLYKSLPEFLKKNFPDIKLSDEIDKLAAIDKLEKSLSFYATHNAIARLNTFDDFTDSDVVRIAGAFEKNNQVHMIFGDTDVANFAKKILPLAKSGEAVEAVKVLELMLEQIEESEDIGEVPF